MKIAYLILCHTDPKHIKRLVDKLTNSTEDAAFVHVDGKTDIEPFLGISDNPQAHLIEKRIPVHWGGFSSVEATINLFKEALSCEIFDRFVILQGLEYPIKANREIHSFFENNADTEFILAQNISDCKNLKEIHKFSLYWLLDSLTIKARVINRINYRFFLRYRIIPRFKRNYVKDANGKKMIIYQGCAQFGVTKSLAEYLVKFYDENDSFNRYFSTMYAPDESYFHTIVYNSEFAAKTTKGKAVISSHITELENLTYFEYPDVVTLFKEKKDWPKLRDSGFLFFRKASSNSQELLNLIDEEHSNENH